MSDFNSFTRFLGSAANALQQGMQFTGQLYRMDAERKYYDAQKTIADRVGQQMMAYETDPDYGQVMMDELPTWAANQGIDYETLDPEQQAVVYAQYNEAVQTMEPTGYMKKFNDLMMSLQRDVVGKIDNPLAKEEAQRYLDQVKRNSAADVYQLQVRKWKEELTAKEFDDMNAIAKTGRPPEESMALINAGLDRLVSVNAISGAQAMEARRGYASQAIGASLTKQAIEVMNTSGLAAAMEYVNTASGSLEINGKTYWMDEGYRGEAGRSVQATWNAIQDQGSDILAQQAVSAMNAIGYNKAAKMVLDQKATFTIGENTYQYDDQARNRALGILNAQWNAVQDSEDQRLQDNYESGRLSKELISGAQLAPRRKWEWESKLNAMEMAADQAAQMSTINPDDLVATVYTAQLRGDVSYSGAVNTIQRAVDTQVLTPEQGSRTINKLRTLLDDQFPMYKETIDQGIDAFNALAMATFKAKNANELKASPAYAAAFSYFTMQLTDMVYNQSLRGLQSEDFQREYSRIVNTSLATYLDVQKNGNYTIEQGSIERDAARIAAFLETEGDKLVYFDDITGQTVWNQFGKDKVEQFANWGTGKAIQDYGIEFGKKDANGRVLTVYTLDRATNQYGDITERAIPIFHDNSGNEYKYIADRNGNLVLNRREGRTWTPLQPTAAIQRKAAEGERQADAQANAIQLPLPQRFIDQFRGDKVRAQQAWDQIEYNDQKAYYNEKGIPIPQPTQRGVQGFIPAAPATESRGGTGSRSITQ